MGRSRNRLAVRMPDPFASEAVAYDVIDMLWQGLEQHWEEKRLAGSAVAYTSTSALRTMMSLVDNVLQAPVPEDVAMRGCWEAEEEPRAAPIDIHARGVIPSKKRYVPPAPLVDLSGRPRRAPSVRSGRSGRSRRGPGRRNTRLTMRAAALGVSRLNRRARHTVVAASTMSPEMGMPASSSPRSVSGDSTGTRSSRRTRISAGGLYKSRHSEFMVDASVEAKRMSPRERLRRSALLERLQREEEASKRSAALQEEVEKERDTMKRLMRETMRGKDYMYDYDGSVVVIERVAGETLPSHLMKPAVDVKDRVEDGGSSSGMTATLLAASERKPPVSRPFFSSVKPKSTLTQSMKLRSGVLLRSGADVRRGPAPRSDPRRRRRSEMARLDTVDMMAMSMPVGHAGGGQTATAAGMTAGGAGRLAVSSSAPDLHSISSPAAALPSLMTEEALSKLARASALARAAVPTGSDPVLAAMNSGDWGRPTPGGGMYSPSPLPKKQARRSHGAAVGSSRKAPRERTVRPLHRRERPLRLVPQQARSPVKLPALSASMSAASLSSFSPIRSMEMDERQFGTSTKRKRQKRRKRNPFARKAEDAVGVEPSALRYLPMLDGSLPKE
eukprot:PLAT10323.1.p1 GENE.PLAT10323.1~~PLAT10323.1.p1  ORF type:complete len:614 (+),score=241.07 PLAT10323.1:31-1872(+)